MTARPMHSQVIGLVAQDQNLMKQGQLKTLIFSAFSD